MGGEQCLKKEDFQICLTKLHFFHDEIWKYLGDVLARAEFRYYGKEE